MLIQYFLNILNDDNSMDLAMPFYLDDSVEITVKNVNDAIVRRQMERLEQHLPCEYNPLPYDANRLALCEYRDVAKYHYGSLNPQCAAGGFTRLVAVFRRKNHKLTDMREPTPEEINIVNRFHGVLTQEEKAEIEHDQAWKISVQIRGKYYEAGLEKASRLIGVTENEIIETLKGEPTKRRGKFIYYQVGDYLIRRNKEE